MRRVVKGISLSQPAPIQIDSTEPNVIDIALQQIPGRAIVNSINLEAGRDKLDKVVPLAKAARRGADRADDRRGRDGQDGRAQARGGQADHRVLLRRARAGPRRADLRLPDVHADHRRPGVAPERRRHDRGHPPGQDRARRACRPRSASPTSPSASGSPRARCSTACSCTTASRPGWTWRWSTRPHHARTRRSPPTSAQLADDLVFDRREDALERVHRPLRVQGSRGGCRERQPDRGHGARGGAALPHPAPQEGGRGGLDRRQRREDRRRADAQHRAAAGDEGGRRQVRRRRADPPVRAAVGRGDEEGRGPARAVPRQARGLHQGHRGARHRVRRRPRHRQVAGQHDPHQQRLHGHRSRQAGADLDDPRGRRRARRDRDRAERAARLHLQADAGCRSRSCTRAGSPIRC